MLVPSQPKSSLNSGRFGYSGLDISYEPQILEPTRELERASQGVRRGKVPRRLP
jgi:hypothetical protein